MSTYSGDPALDRLIAENATAAGVPLDLAMRLIANESAFKQSSRSKKGAIGLGQLMPATAADPGYGLRPADPYDPEDNLRLSMEYLRKMYDKTGDWKNAVMAYNAGLGNRKAADKPYVNRVLGGGAPPPSTPAPAADVGPEFFGFGAAGEGVAAGASSEASAGYVSPDYFGFGATPSTSVPSTAAIAPEPPELSPSHWETPKNVAPGLWETVNKVAPEAWEGAKSAAAATWDALQTKENLDEIAARARLMGMTPAGGPSIGGTAPNPTVPKTPELATKDRNVLQKFLSLAGEPGQYYQSEDAEGFGTPEGEGIFARTGEAAEKAVKGSVASFQAAGGVQAMDFAKPNVGPLVEDITAPRLLVGTEEKQFDDIEGADLGAVLKGVANLGALMKKTFDYSGNAVIRAGAYGIGFPMARVQENPEETFKLATNTLAELGADNLVAGVTKMIENAKPEDLPAIADAVYDTLSSVTQSAPAFVMAMFGQPLAGMSFFGLQTYNTSKALGMANGLTGAALDQYATLQMLTETLPEFGPMAVVSKSWKEGFVKKLVTFLGLDVGGEVASNTGSLFVDLYAGLDKEVTGQEIAEALRSSVQGAVGTSLFFGALKGGGTGFLKLVDKLQNRLSPEALESIINKMREAGQLPDDITTQEILDRIAENIKTRAANITAEGAGIADPSKTDKGVTAGGGTWEWKLDYQPNQPPFGAKLYVEVDPVQGLYFEENLPISETERKYRVKKAKELRTGLQAMGWSNPSLDAAVAAEAALDKGDITENEYLDFWAGRVSSLLRREGFFTQTLYSHPAYMAIAQVIKKDIDRVTSDADSYSVKFADVGDPLYNVIKPGDVLFLRTPTGLSHFGKSALEKRADDIGKRIAGQEKGLVNPAMQIILERKARGRQILANELSSWLKEFLPGYAATVSYAAARTGKFKFIVPQHASGGRPPIIQLQIPATNDFEQLAVLGHEFGHALDAITLQGMPQFIKEAVNADYKIWYDKVWRKGGGDPSLWEKNRKTTFEDSAGYTAGDWGRIQMEWIADGISRYMLNNALPNLSPETKQYFEEAGTTLENFVTTIAAANEGTVAGETISTADSIRLWFEERKRGEIERTFTAEERAKPLREAPPELWHALKSGRFLAVDEALRNLLLRPGTEGQEQMTAERQAEYNRRRKEAWDKLRREYKQLQKLENPPDWVGEEPQMPPPSGATGATPPANLFGKSVLSGLSPQQQAAILNSLTKSLTRFGKFRSTVLTLLQITEENPHILGLQQYAEHVREWHRQVSTGLLQPDQRLKEWHKLFNVGPYAAYRERFAKFRFEVTKASYRVKQKLPLTRADRMVIVNKLNSDLASAISSSAHAEVRRLRKELNLWNQGYSIEELANRQDIGIGNVPRATGTYTAGNQVKVPYPTMLEFSETLDRDFEAALTDLYDTLEMQLRKEWAHDPVQLGLELIQLNRERHEIIKRNYSPLSRFGNYLVVFKNAKKKTLAMEAYETEGEQLTRIREFNQGAPQGQTAEPRFVTDLERSLIAMPPRLVAKLSKELNLTDKQKVDLGQYLHALSPAQSFARHRVKRRLVEGYSMDFERGYASYFMSFAHHLARVKYSDLLDADIELTKAQSLAAAKVAPTATENRKISDVAKWMQRHREYILNPGEELVALRSLAFMFYLGGAAGSAFNNLMQVPMASAPYLAKRFNKWLSPMMAEREIGKAYIDYRKMLRGQNLEPELLLALQKAEEEQFLRESLATEVAGISQGSVLEKLMPKKVMGSRGVGRLQRKATGVATWMFQASEQLNRFVTFAAAFRLANQDALNKIPPNVRTAADVKAAAEEAYNFARQAVLDTQLEYARFNRPEMARGKKSALFLFKMYPQGMLWYMAKNKGGFRFWMALAAMGGLEGMPEASGSLEVLNAAITAYKRMTGVADPHTDIRLTVRDLVEDIGLNPDLIMHGLSRYSYGLGMLGQSLGLPIPNSDFSSSVGMGTLIPGLSSAIKAVRTGGTPQDEQKEFLGAAMEAAGPVPAMLYNTLWGWWAAGEGYETQARLQALPRALRTPLEAGMWWNEGAVMDNRHTAKLLEFDPTNVEHMGEVIMKGLMQANPTALSLQRDLNWATKQRARYYATWREELAYQTQQAIISGDPEAKAEADAEWNRYNDMAPEEFKVSVKARMQSLRQREKSRQQQEEYGATGVSSIRQRNALQHLFRPPGGSPGAGAGTGE